MYIVNFDFPGLLFVGAFGLGGKPNPEAAKINPFGVAASTAGGSGLFGGSKLKTLPNFFVKLIESFISVATSDDGFMVMRRCLKCQVYVFIYYRPEKAVILMRQAATCGFGESSDGAFVYRLMRPFQMGKP